MDALFRVPAPANEPVLGYAPGSPERASLEAELARMGGERIDLPSTIGGRKVMGGGRAAKVVQPHAHRKVLGQMKLVTATEAQSAIDAAKAAAPMWRDMAFADRAAILLKAAELLSGPWRATLNAATMLGQSKTAPQAEIDSACELIDFWRINVHFAEQILSEQPPLNSKGVWNRSDYRSLEGFVYAITPFNFTAIGGNLPTAPALMGNTVVWKPARTQQLAAHYTMALAFTSPARLGSSTRCGSRSERTSAATRPTRASSARPGARTSSSRTRRPTSTSCAPRWSAARRCGRPEAALPDPTGMPRWRRPRLRRRRGPARPLRRSSTSRWVPGGRDRRRGAAVATCPMRPASARHRASAPGRPAVTAGPRPR
jgi:hypothetical protein